jgi:hypothetical protein
MPAELLVDDSWPPHVGAWLWRCADCRGILLWVRDNFQGRRLLAVLMHDAEATAEELMERRDLIFVPDASAQMPMLACCCDANGPTLSPEMLMRMRQVY